VGNWTRCKWSELKRIVKPCTVKLVVRQRVWITSLNKTVKKSLSSPVCHADERTTNYRGVSTAAVEHYTGSRDTNYAELQPYVFDKVHTFPPQRPPALPRSKIFSCVIKSTFSILSPEDGNSMFLRNIVSTYKSTRRYSPRTNIDNFIDFLKTDSCYKTDKRHRLKHWHNRIQKTVNGLHTGLEAFPPTEVVQLNVQIVVKSV
jgi:hypothetical protein